MIWHDNTSGSDAGWFLGKIVFIDLQQKRWLVTVFNQTTLALHKVTKHSNQWRRQTIKSGSAFKGQLYFQVGQSETREARSV